MVNEVIKLNDFGFSDIPEELPAQPAETQPSVSPETIDRMVSFFARHGVNRSQHFEFQNNEPTAWRIAWDLWGGDAGNTWVNKIKRQMTNADKKED